jgi:hypothetical protein
MRKRPNINDDLDSLHTHEGLCACASGCDTYTYICEEKEKERERERERKKERKRERERERERERIRENTGESACVCRLCAWVRELEYLNVCVFRSAAPTT